jgi:2-polyprenyl-3-methyl-5-hydroxy-6-metoxy-1,4-benzoquinol methylase
MTVTAPDAATRRDALAERLFGAALGAFDLLTIALGDRLGLYRSLATDGPATPAELAKRTGIAPRYAREWLEGQAVGGLLEVDDVTAGPEDRRYRLPDGYGDVLVDPDNLATMTPMAEFIVAAGDSMADLADAYRTGGGVPWAAYPEVPEAEARFNRPAFANLLTSEWTPALADIHVRLRTSGGRIADIACGKGWSTIALARGYPLATVDGLDLDEGSIEDATRRLASDAPDVADRVTFQVRDAADPNFAGRYDLAMIFEAFHDMARPVEVLRAVRGLLAPGGALLVVDERVNDTFVAPGDEVERMMYAYSVLFCLPNTLAEPGSAGTGTVLRSAALRRLAEEAGFGGVTILPIDHPTFRFYRLDP